MKAIRTAAVIANFLVICFVIFALFNYGVTEESLIFILLLTVAPCLNLIAILYQANNESFVLNEGLKNFLIKACIPLLILALLYLIMPKYHYLCNSDGEISAKYNAITGWKKQYRIGKI